MNILSGLHPVGFSLLKYNLPNYIKNILGYSKLIFPHRHLIIQNLPMFNHMEYVQNLPFKPKFLHFKIQITFLETLVHELSVFQK